MRTLVISTMLTLSIVHACSAAQGSNETFASFWKTFKAAVARNDGQAVANQTRLPFLYDSRERDRAAFIKIYPRLFTPKIRRCLARTEPMRERENYEVFCGELIFYFGKDTDGKYKLLEFGVND